MGVVHQSLRVGIFPTHGPPSIRAKHVPALVPGPRPQTSKPRTVPGRARVSSLITILHPSNDAKLPCHVPGYLITESVRMGHIVLGLKVGGGGGGGWPQSLRDRQTDTCHRIKGSCNSYAISAPRKASGGFPVHHGPRFQGGGGVLFRAVPDPVLAEIQIIQRRV